MYTKTLRGPKGNRVTLPPPRIDTIDIYKIVPGNPTLWRESQWLPYKNLSAGAGETENWKNYRFLPNVAPTHSLVPPIRYRKVRIDPFMTNMRNPDFLPPRWWMLPCLLWFGHVNWTTNVKWTTKKLATSFWDPISSKLATCSGYIQSAYKWLTQLFSNAYINGLVQERRNSSVLAMESFLH